MLNKPVIIMPFTLPWDWSADYQKQTCLELARKNFNIWIYSNDHAHFFLKKNVHSQPHYDNIFFYSPKYLIPFRRFKIIEKINSYLSKLLFSFKFINQKKIIWIFDPQFYNFMNIFNKKISLYDCVDYHSTNNPFQNIRIRIEEKKLINNVDHFFVNSKTLHEIHSKVKKSIIVPQGFRLHEFNKPSKVKKNRNKKRPIVGYIGSINYRLDFKLLDKLIDNNPHWEFNFWGPIQRSQKMIDKEIALILKKKNVKWNMTKNHHELISVISNFDVCIIPYNIRQKLNMYSYPMKLFEYFYVGKPVVTTPIKELRRAKFRKTLKISTDHLEWENDIDNFLKNGLDSLTRKKQRTFSIENSWEKKITTILNNLENH